MNEAAAVVAKAEVVSNDGQMAVVFTDKGKSFMMYRGANSRQEFLKQFPLSGEVELTLYKVRDRYNAPLQ